MNQISWIVSHRLIWCLVNNNYKFSDSLSAEILKLAIKYDMGVSIDYCEKFLVDSKNYSKMDLLDLAEQYSLNNLKVCPKIIN